MKRDKAAKKESSKGRIGQIKKFTESKLRSAGFSKKQVEAMTLPSFVEAKEGSSEKRTPLEQRALIFCILILKVVRRSISATRSRNYDEITECGIELGMLMAAIDEMERISATNKNRALKAGEKRTIAGMKYWILHYASEQTH